MFVVCKLLLMDVFPHRFDSLQQFDIYFALFLDMVIFVNKGFRSRVKYFSIVDPTQTTYYISEILDAGLQGPLFMVSFSFLYGLRTCSLSHPMATSGEDRGVRISTSSPGRLYVPGATFFSMFISVS